MSSTRRAPEGAPFSQERFASSPALEKGLNAVLVKNRCAVLSDPAEIEMIWFLQYQSLQPGGLEKFVACLLDAFPNRIGTPAMLEIGVRKGAYTSDQQIEIARENWDGFYEAYDLRPSPAFPRFTNLLEVCQKTLLDELPNVLRKLCLDPAFAPALLDDENIRSDVYALRAKPGVPFRDLRGALLLSVTEWARRRLSGLVKTEVGKSILDALDYMETERVLVLIEGVYGTGKTFVAKAWCEARPGRRRYVQCPSSNDNLDFFRTLAEPLGVSNAYSMKGQEMRVRVNDVMQAGYFSLVMDESQYAWPQCSTRGALPARVNWIQTALVNYGVPVALVATPQFTKSQAEVEKNTLWTSGQFIGRISRYITLPESLDEADLRAIARFHMPKGDAKSIEALVLYACASKKRLRGIEHGIKAARHVARLAGRSEMTFSDIRQAMKESVMPSDSALTAALTTPPKGAPAAGRVGKRKIFDTSSKTRLFSPESVRISEPAPID